MQALTAANDLIPVRVNAWSNKYQRSQQITIEIERWKSRSDYAINRMVKEKLGAEWQYNDTPVGF